MSWLETRIPPPIAAGLFALAMWGIARLLPHFSVVVPGSGILAAVLCASGILIDVAAMFSFRRHRTSVNPIDPTAAGTVVTTGLYKHSRNPMYLGLVLLLSALAAKLSNVASLLVVPLFVLYMNRFQIGPEERALAQKFGADYDRYRETVRRWW